MLLKILVYSFFAAGTISFLAELTWRISHWKDKGDTKITTCNITVDANSRISTEELIKKLGDSLNNNGFKV